MTAESKALRERSAEAVQADVVRLLESELNDAALLEQLEQLSRARRFDGLTWLWGPVLYQRSRVRFGPFIRTHFSRFSIGKRGAMRAVPWEGDAGQRLDAWLTEVDAADDFFLFQQLYHWKHSQGSFRISAWEPRWRTDLLQAFREASTPAQRVLALQKYDLPGTLDENTAVALYQTDPAAAGPFIMKHMAFLWGSEKRLWEKLIAAAHARGDQHLGYQVYRRMVDEKRWRADALKLAETVTDPADLCRELGLRHPEGWQIPPGNTFCVLLEKRGSDVLPYVRQHLRTMFRSWLGFRDGYARLIALAAKHEWWDLWSALVRTCATDAEFNQNVRRLLKLAADSPDIARERLLMLAGVAREWNFGPWGIIQVRQLEDDVAILFHERFPELLRGPFRSSLAVGNFGVLPGFTEKLLAAADEQLIDFLASRLITRTASPWGFGVEQLRAAERLSQYYEGFRDDESRFSARAVRVLSQVPAYSIRQYHQLIRTNRLARLFYARSASGFLADGAGIRNLLESPEIHAQALAFRVLGLEDRTARDLAAENLDLLLPTLLRALHRRTRLLAFRALENAAGTPNRARRIHDRCREALDLPDRKYPKEQLVGLIGRLLRRWPELCLPAERCIATTSPREVA